MDFKIKTDFNADSRILFKHAREYIKGFKYKGHFFDSNELNKDQLIILINELNNENTLLKEDINDLNMEVTELKELIKETRWDLDLD